MNKLADVMTPKPFHKGDYLMHKGDEADYFYIIDVSTNPIGNIGLRYQRIVVV